MNLNAWSSYVPLFSAYEADAQYLNCTCALLLALCVNEFRKSKNWPHNHRSQAIITACLRSQRKLSGPGSYVFWFFERIVTSFYLRLKGWSGIGDECLPSASTVVFAVVLFAIYLGFGSAAVALPTYPMLMTFLVASGLIFAILCSEVVHDWLSRGKFWISPRVSCKLIYFLGARQYKRNLGNTLLTIWSTILVMTVLYAKSWYPALNLMVIEFQSDMVTAPRFPAIACFQGTGNSEAILQPAPLKCNSGIWNLDTHAPLCSMLTVQEALDTPSCDCSDDWPSLDQLNNKQSAIEFENISTTYITLVPGESTVSRGAGHFMTAQIFFFCKPFLPHRAPGMCSGRGSEDRRSPLMMRRQYHRILL